MVAVLVAVHHAKVIILRVGEPFGTLVLVLVIIVVEAIADHLEILSSVRQRAH
jgi:Ca2+/H+ antiporter